MVKGGLFRQGWRTPSTRSIHGPQTMDISHPLSRARSVSEIAYANSQLSIPKFQQKRRFGNFSRFIKPKRYSFYIPGKQNLRYILVPTRHFSRAPQSLKVKTKKLQQRFFSVEARKKRQQQRRFIRWWTLTSLTIVLGSVASKIAYERGEEFPNEYKIKPQSWHLYAYSTLPLKAISRLWGQVNSINLPVWVRSPSYRIYSAIFGVRLDEMEEPDLRTYPNLSEFFYRKLKPGVRPIAGTDLVSPADGKVLKFGIVEDGEIEQVKGMTYSVDALLGVKQERIAAPSHSPDFHDDDDETTLYSKHEEFAKIHGIEYSDSEEEKKDTFVNKLGYKDEGDGTASGSKSSYQQEIAVAKNLTQTRSDIMKASENKQLYFAVIYLAPGDYHRFHSPTNWVTTLRRHFIGELFSVAPFFQKTLQGLFVLNERVALLGYWKYGFFSMIPVGATNVGSIIVNFDKDLKTNERYEHEVYSKNLGETTPLLGGSTSEVSTISTTPNVAEKKKLKKNTVYEATYTKASRLLGGYPVTKGQEIGGFKLGSTVVLVFEAPDNFKFDLQVGQKVKMGQSLGRFVAQN
jgi:phosphatidylserine decarboxylase